MILEKNEKGAIILFIVGIILFTIDAPLLGALCIIVGLVKLDS